MRRYAPDPARQVRALLWLLAARDGNAHSYLDKKVASDPEVAEALRLLSPWASSQEQDDETTNRHE
jgi:hypothetical protein